MKNTHPLFTQIKMKDLGELGDLLLRACPPDDSGAVSIRHLANLTGVGVMNIYRWCRDDRLPANRVNHIVLLNNHYWLKRGIKGGAGVVSESDFAKFIKGDTK